MMAAAPNLNVVPDRPAYDVLPEEPDQNRSAALEATMLLLRTLSQKTLIAISRLFTLLTVMSVFYLFLSIPNPSPYQITWGALYAAFVLAANWLVRKA